MESLGEIDWKQLREKELESDDEVKELESEGEENKQIEENIEDALEELRENSYEDLEKEDLFQQSIDLETGETDTCQLCKIYRPPFDQSETIYFQTDDFYVVDTYDKKDHDARNMGVQKKHGEIPPINQGVEILDKLAELTAEEIQDGEMILYGSMKTFSEHFHFVASDIYGEDGEEVEDLDSINSYARFEVEDGELAYDHEGSRYRDSFGEYLEEWRERSSLNF